MKRTNQKGVTLIALIVTIIVLIIIAGISIATLTGDNGVLQQTNAARVTQIEGTAREQVELGCSALKLAIEEAVANDGTYSALDNASKIQYVLVDVLEKDKAGLDGKFTKADTEEADKIAIKYVGDDYKNATNNTEAEIIYTIELGKGSIELVDEENATLKDENGNDINIDIGGGTVTVVPIPTTETYVGYYANLDADEEPEGIIYADLAIGGSGQWFDEDGVYSYDAITGTKDYYVSTEDYEGPFGTKDVLTLVPGSTGADRFYVMALEDFTTADYTSFYWYNSAYSNKISDYSSITSNEFGTGKDNTDNMIAAWKVPSYGSQNARDMWGVIQEKVNEGWFVPSRGEWGAFGNNLGITSNYSSFGLSHDCWSSSLCATHRAWDAYFYDGWMSGDDLDYACYVRLSATF